MEAKFKVGQQVKLTDSVAFWTVRYGPPSRGNTRWRRTMAKLAIATETHMAVQVKRHIFGGVVFEETGEVREPKVGEWALNARAGHPFFWAVNARLAWDQGSPRYTILRPVAIE